MIHTATNKARVIITVDGGLLKEIEDYHHDNRFKDRTKAILSLIRAGLDSAKAAQLPPKPEADSNVGATTEGGES